MKITRKYLHKVIKEEIENLSELDPQGGKTQGPKQKSDVERISKVLDKLPQLQRLFKMINTQDELSQILDVLIKGVAEAKTINAAMLTKILRAKASEAGGLTGEK